MWGASGASYSDPDHQSLNVAELNGDRYKRIVSKDRSRYGLARERWLAEAKSDFKTIAAPRCVIAILPLRLLLLSAKSKSMRQLRCAAD